MEEKSPAQIVQELREVRSSWSDEQILAELTDLPVLPDEESNAWDKQETWDQAAIYLALSDLIGERKIRAGVLLLLERASYGDIGEIMRGLRHRLEAAFNPDWSALADVCMEAAKLPARGARLWAVEELGRIRDPRALPILIDALHDPAKLVCWNASSALDMLCQKHPECCEQAVQALKKHIQRYKQTVDFFERELASIERSII